MMRLLLLSVNKQVSVNFHTPNETLKIHGNLDIQEKGVPRKECPSRQHQPPTLSFAVYMTRESGSLVLIEERAGN
jgi:hypothetical protein